VLNNHTAQDCIPLQQVGTEMYVYIYPSAKSTLNWEYGRTESGGVMNNNVNATMSLVDKIRYAGQTACTELGKRVCQCYTRNHQPPTARLLAAALEKMRDVPEKCLREIGVSYGFAMTWKKCFCKMNTANISLFSK
jgi:hypothetical protein